MKIVPLNFGHIPPTRNLMEQQPNTVGVRLGGDPTDLYVFVKYWGEILPIFFLVSLLLL